MPVIKSIILNGNTYTFSGGTPGPTPHPTGPATIDFLLVGGGGGGGTACGYWGTGGGGGGGIIHCEGIELQSGTYCVVIGCGGSGLHNSFGLRQGGDSCFGEFVAYGGGGGGNGAQCANTARPFNGCDGASGGGGGGASCCLDYTPAGGTGCQGCSGGGGMRHPNYSPGGGGGGYSTDGCEGSWECTQVFKYNVCGGDGGMGYCSDISGTMEYYSFGGGGGASLSPTAVSVYGGTACNGIGYCGGGCGDATNDGVNNCNATTYGSGGGGGRGIDSGCCYCCVPSGGNGCQGVLIVRYPAKCNYRIRGGNGYVCGSYKIHRFTSDGELCINI